MSKTRSSVAKPIVIVQTLTDAFFNEIGSELHDLKTKDIPTKKTPSEFRIMKSMQSIV